jgi:hypothetical protein
VPKSGRPPLEPRIAALEAQLEALKAEMWAKFAEIAKWAELNQQASSQEGFRAVPRGTYQSQFDKWPDSRPKLPPRSV